MGLTSLQEGSFIEYRYGLVFGDFKNKTQPFNADKAG